MRALRLLVFCCSMLRAAEAGQAIVDGGFAQPLGAPWERMGDPSSVTIVEEGGTRFVRLRQEQPGAAAVAQHVPIGADWTGLRISARVRATDLRGGPQAWDRPALQYLFEDADGKHVGDWPRQIVAGDQDWSVVTGHVAAIPPGAARLTVMCGLFACAGTADFTAVSVVPERAGELPAGLRLAGGEPVDELGHRRGRVCLDGVWRFEPARAEAEAAPLAASWGFIDVPGTWTEKANFPGIIAGGAGAAWRGLNADQLAKAWYERPLAVPTAWTGRRILLDLRRLSTDAVVFLDGAEVGRVAWPAGEVDLTASARPGTTQALRLLVAAVPDAGKVISAMGVGQNTLVDAKLATRGLIGEVFLVSRPPAARVDDVWVRTSVRRGQLGVDIDLADLPGAGPVDVTATITDADGAVAATFDQRVDAAAGASTLSLSWPWRDARRWDVSQPNLYTLDLSAHGAGLPEDAGIRQAFGFRECWIDGRTIYLNGTPFRLRPTSSIPEGDFSANNGCLPVLASAIDDILSAGFNCVELWPFDQTVRGTYHFRELICELADRKGLPILGPALSAATMFAGWDGRGSWTDAAARARWREAMRAEWKRYRNDPSIIAWSTCGNMGGHQDDQDPRRLGRGLADPAWSAEERSDPGWFAHHRQLDEMVAEIERVDPTRPVMIHQGGPAGDIFGVNNYLCLTQLQEREEWLSDWSVSGSKPYMAVEFGTPLSSTMGRGRDGFVANQLSEWLMTEFCAGYLGADAYRLETDDYRREIAAKYRGGQQWDWPDQGLLDYAPAFQRLDELFIANTWRSWRTMGVTGGMIPWADGHGFKPVRAAVAVPAPTPGQRGTRFATVARQPFTPFSAPGAEIMPGGKALLANNAATLAWICGPAIAGDPGDFTAKDHSYRSGETLAKRVALLNDSRREQAWSLRARATLDGAEIAVVEQSGRIGVGETLFVPLSAALPRVDAKRDGAIELEARIGEAAHRDRFAFRVFPAQAPLGLAVEAVDPSGETTAMLRALGVEVAPWRGGAAAMVVIGRRALSSGADMPGDLEAYVRGGGRLLVMAQDPEWTGRALGLRVAGALSRRVFRVDARHGLVAGLDDDDLRDWRGASTLVQGRPDYRDPGQPRHLMPIHGWRWGGRGAVCTAAFEKPHRAGWRPLLECEFDLAYAPVLELDLGGRAVLCALDLEDHAAQDPAAALLARNLLGWLRAAPLAPAPTPAVYVGGDEGARLLDLVGCEYRRAPTADAHAALTILGPEVALGTAAAALDAGGRVLALPRRAGGPAGLGIEVVHADACHGSLEVPAWPEARGLSASDLRWRAEAPAWLLRGEGVASDGLLARVTRGSGVALLCQADALAIPADEKAYFRYTRWRETRQLAQLIANLGGALAGDARPLHPTPRIALAGWKAAWTAKRPSAEKPLADPGLSEAAARLLGRDADESAMAPVPPGLWAEMASADGEAVFRCHVQVPRALAGSPMVLRLGAIDDFDVTMVNGTRVGATDAATKEHWRAPRVYRIPAGVLAVGDNVVAVRVFDQFGGGGLVGPAAEMAIELDAPAPPTLYHPDYRADFELGDDPFRYYRW